MSQDHGNPPSTRYQGVLFVRLFFVLLATLIASLFAWDTRNSSMVFSLLGFFAAGLIVFIEIAMQGLSSRKVVLALGGLFLGLICAQLIYPTVGWILILGAEFSDKLFNRGIDAYMNRSEVPRDALISAAHFLCQWSLGYFGIITALRHSDWLRLSNLRLQLANPADRPKVLDTSVIIDGRVVELAALGVFEGQVVVPKFVLLELQALADHEDGQKRVRGKRGLDILEKLKARCPTLELDEHDYGTTDGVDHKLVRLCRQIDGVLYTNDASLQKIAHLQQVSVVNLHELAEAMRPSVYVGEVMHVRIIKPGKEPDQGVGFLDDGTMVVVDGGARFVGRDCEAAITSILQNPSGRMIFGKRVGEEPSAKGSAA